MTSPRRKQGNPIESVELKVTFEGDGDELRRIRRAVPGAISRKGAVEVTIRGDGPAEVAEKTKVLADRVRSALERNERGSGTRKKRRSSKRL